MTLGQLVLVAVLLVVVGATQLLSVRSYQGMASATADFNLAQNVTGDLADAQRDALEIALYVERLEHGGSLADARMHVAFLGQQLRNLLPQTMPADAKARVQAAYAGQQRLAAQLDALQGKPVSAAVVALPQLRATSEALQVNLKGLYARFEISFYDRLRDTLASRAGWQRWVVGGASLAALVGIGLAWSLRRTVRRDFERAYDLLLEESEEREAAQDELERVAFHDRLTGLPNRLALEQKLDALAARGAHGAIVSIDLDRLGAVNRSYGSETGDALLRIVAARLAAAAPGAVPAASEHFVAHLGGDEFALLLPCFDDAEAPSAADAVQAIASLVRALEEPAIVDGHRVTVTACAGVALGAFAEGQGHELARHADAALHQAKIAGRGKVALFDDQRHRDLQQRSAVATRLSRAEADGELLLHYQPLVDAGQGSAAGLEGLLRWNRDGQLVPPNEFIPVAEESGLIVPMGAWVVDRVCRDLSRLRQTPAGRHLFASVNLAASQLHDPNLIPHIAGCLSRHGLPAGSLVVELTESALVEDTAQAERVLAALRELGVRVAIDDFGTGYSSLAYLRQIPADILKIDRSLIRDITTDDRTVRLLEGIVSLAHDLGMRVTVEGVETEEQLALVKASGCDTIQGFLVSRPVPMSAVDGLLRRLPAPRAAADAA